MPLTRLNRLKRTPLIAWPFQTELLFPLGLFGFEHYVRYWLIGHQKEIPLLRIEAKENSTFFFYVIDPFLGCPNYAPSLSQRDLQEVGVHDETKLVMFVIVNVKECPFTMNLASPLLIHWSKKLGKQLLIEDNSEYPLNGLHNARFD